LPSISSCRGRAAVKEVQQQHLIHTQHFYKLLSQQQHGQSTPPSHGMISETCSQCNTAQCCCCVFVVMVSAQAPSRLLGQVNSAVHAGNHCLQLLTQLSVKMLECRASH
jgi:hypothetical protein